MAIPTITSVSPTTGPAAGGTLVTVHGGGFNVPSVEGDGARVEVYFGDVPATEVAVWSPDRITCISPGGSLGVAPVMVRNYTPPGPVEQSVTLFPAFTYKRPNISTPGDLSGYQDLTIVTRGLIEELRRCVVPEVHHDTHGEYASVVSAIAGEEKQAPAPPFITITGPRVTDDRFYATNGRIDVETSDDVFATYEEPDTVQLLFTYIGFGSTKAETTNLWRALVRFLKLNPDLRLTIGGEVHRFPMEVPFDQRAEFAPATRANIHTFTGQLLIRGVNLLSELRREGHGVGEDGATIDATPLD